MPIDAIDDEDDDRRLPVDVIDDEDVFAGGNSAPGIVDRVHIKIKVQIKIKSSDIHFVMSPILKIYLILMTFFMITALYLILCSVLDYLLQSYLTYEQSFHNWNLKI